MSLTFRCLCSGSDGNSYFFSTEEGCFLIDAGGAFRRQKEALYNMGIKTSMLTAIFVTHDHLDHSRNLGSFQRDAAKMGHDLPIYLTAPVLEGIRCNMAIHKKPTTVHLIEKGVSIYCCGCRVIPFEVPHDSRDNVGYLVEYQDSSICLLTDVGYVTDSIHTYLRQTRNLILESNYDAYMLAHGPYSEHLKQRVASSNGHLDNVDAAEIIFRYRQQFDHVWLCHLSEKNNTPEKALSTISARFTSEGFSMDDAPAIVPLRHRVPSEIYQL